MTNFVCAVADCRSNSTYRAKKYPFMQGVKGWARFPSKRQAVRRRLWEQRCRRGPDWRATRNHAICSKHFIDWENDAPSTRHPDPELFAYSGWGKKCFGRGAISKNILQERNGKDPTILKNGTKRQTTTNTDIRVVSVYIFGGVQDWCEAVVSSREELPTDSPAGLAVEEKCLTAAPYEDHSYSNTHSITDRGEENSPADVGMQSDDVKILMRVEDMAESDKGADVQAILEPEILMQVNTEPEEASQHGPVPAVQRSERETTSSAPLPDSPAVTEEVIATQNLVHNFDIKKAVDLTVECWRFMSVATVRHGWRKVLPWIEEAAGSGDEHSTTERQIVAAAMGSLLQVAKGLPTSDDDLIGASNIEKLVGKRVAEASVDETTEKEALEEQRKEEARDEPTTRQLTDIFTQAEKLKETICNLDPAADRRETCIQLIQKGLNEYKQLYQTRMNNR